MVYPIFLWGLFGGLIGMFIIAPSFVSGLGVGISLVAAINSTLLEAYRS